MKRKLSLYLVEELGYPTRSRAHNAIKSGNVSVNGRTITKDGYLVDDEDEIVIVNSDIGYVSRGALKLKAALDQFKIDLTDKTVLDIGASTGGFTDCCLQENARKVYAYDVGHDQLAEKLRNDPRVISQEGVNCRYLTKDNFKDIIDFICMDVSFISCTKMLNAISDILPVNGQAVVLFKPQFEVGSDNLNSHGIWKNEEAVTTALEDCKNQADKLKLKLEKTIPSPVIGQDGNREFLILFTKV